MTAQISKGQKTATDISSLLRARNPLIQVISREEARVEGFLAEAAAAAGYKILFWDIAQGVTTLDGKPASQFRDAQDPGAAFAFVRSEADKGEKGERQVWVFRAEQLAGRTVNKEALAAGVHSHDGGQTFGPGH